MKLSKKLLLNHAPESDPGRYNMNYLVFTKDGLMSSDGEMVIVLPYPDGETFDPQLLGRRIPFETATAAARAMKKKYDDVTATPAPGSDTDVTLTVGSQSFTGSMGDKQYPNVQSVLDSMAKDPAVFQFNATAGVLRAALEALDNAASMRDGEPIVTIHVCGSQDTEQHFYLATKDGCGALVMGVTAGPSNHIPMMGGVVVEEKTNA